MISIHRHLLFLTITESSRVGINYERGKDPNSKLLCFVERPEIYVSAVVAKLIINSLYSSGASLKVCNVGTGRVGKVQYIVQELGRVRTSMGRRKEANCIDSFGQVFVHCTLPCEYIGFLNDQASHAVPYERY